MYQKDVAKQFGLGSQNAITRLERGDFAGLTVPVLRGIVAFAKQQGASAYCDGSHCFCMVVVSAPALPSQKAAQKPPSICR